MALVIGIPREIVLRRVPRQVLVENVDEQVPVEGRASWAVPCPLGLPSD